MKSIKSLYLCVASLHHVSKKLKGLPDGHGWLATVQCYGQKGHSDTTQPFLTCVAICTEEGSHHLQINNEYKQLEVFVCLLLFVCVLLFFCFYFLLILLLLLFLLNLLLYSFCFLSFVLVFQGIEQLGPSFPILVSSACLFCIILYHFFTFSCSF